MALAIRGLHNENEGKVKIVEAIIESIRNNAITIAKALGAKVKTPAKRDKKKLEYADDGTPKLKSVLALLGAGTKGVR